MRQPDFPPGEGYGSHQIDYMYGAGYPTPRDALDAALAVGHGHLASGDFSSRAVRIGDEAAREFTLERPYGGMWVLAVATPGMDGGWLVSSVYECFP
jgi:hypothetical protein